MQRRSGHRGITKSAASGRAAAHTPNAEAQRAETQRRQGAAKKAWDPASHPAWLTEGAYRQRVQPLLAGMKTASIAATLGVTWAYAANIRQESPASTALARLGD